MRRLPLLLLLGLLLALTTAGCAARMAAPGLSKQSESDRAAWGAAPAAQAMATAAPAMPTAAAAGAPGEANYSAHTDAYQADRKIIFTANMQLVVKDTDKTVSAIKSLVAGQGGYVGAANVWHDGNLVNAQLTLRVPADKMEPFLAEVKKLAVRVEREESGGQDVTEEYVDLQSQLRNLQATETELRALLADVRQKTGKAEDVMTVYRELTSIRGQIEQIQGRVQYLDRSAAMATVNLTLSEREPEPIGEAGWQPLQTARHALSVLVEALKFGVDAAISIAIVGVPLLGVPAFAIWLLVRLLRRRRTTRTPAPTP